MTKVLDQLMEGKYKDLISLKSWEKVEKMIT